MKGLLWAKDDKRIISSDDGGAIYEWEISTGNRLFDCVEKEFEYIDVVATKDISWTIVLSKCGSLRDVADGSIINEMKCIATSSFSAMSTTNYSSLLIAGTANGYLIEIDLPFNEQDHKEHPAKR